MECPSTAPIPNDSDTPDITTLRQSVVSTVLGRASLTTRTSLTTRPSSVPPSTVTTHPELSAFPSAIPRLGGVGPDLPPRRLGTVKCPSNFPSFSELEREGVEGGRDGGVLRVMDGREGVEVRGRDRGEVEVMDGRETVEGKVVEGSCEVGDEEGVGVDEVEEIMMVCHDGLGGDGDEVAPRTLDLESTQLDASSSLLESSSTTDLESMQPAASLSLLASTSGDVETQYVALETVNGQCDLPLAVFDVMTDETTAGHCFTDVASSLVGTVEYDSAASSWELTDPTPPSPTMDDTPHKRPSSSPRRDTSKAPAKQKTPTPQPTKDRSRTPDTLRLDIHPRQRSPSNPQAQPAHATAPSPQPLTAPPRLAPTLIPTTPTTSRIPVPRSRSTSNASTQDPTISIIPATPIEAPSPGRVRFDNDDNDDNVRGRPRSRSNATSTTPTKPLKSSRPTSPDRPRSRSVSSRSGVVVVVEGDGGTPKRHSVTSRTASPTRTRSLSDSTAKNAPVKGVAKKASVEPVSPRRSLAAGNGKKADTPMRVGRSNSASSGGMDAVVPEVVVAPRVSVSTTLPSTTKLTIDTSPITLVTAESTDTESLQPSEDLKPCAATPTAESLTRSPSGRGRKTFFSSRPTTIDMEASVALLKRVEMLETKLRRHDRVIHALVKDVSALKGKNGMSMGALAGKMKDEVGGEMMTPFSMAFEGYVAEVTGVGYGLGVVKGKGKTEAVKSNQSIALSDVSDVGSGQ